MVSIIQKQMYKVFCNNRVIEIEGGYGGTDDHLPFLVNNVHVNTGTLQSKIDAFLEGDELKINIRHSNPDKLWEIFRSRFCFIKAAGGIVRKNREILFIFRNGKWDLPKGKVEKGESPEEAAIREVMEECGLPSVNLIHSCVPTYHIYRSEFSHSKDQWMLKETYWYEMEYTEDQIPIPQVEEGITETRWFTPENFNVVLANTWDSLVPVIRSIGRSF